MNSSDLKRLEEARLKIFGLVAQKMLMKKKDPFFLSSREIESNGTVAKKTIRVLSSEEYITFSSKSSSRWYKDYHVLKFFEESEEYAKATNFSNDKMFQDIDSYIAFNYTHRKTSNHPNLDEAGQTEIHNLSWEESLWVYWHIEDYVFDSGKSWGEVKSPMYVTSKAIYENHIHQVARNLVDVYIKHRLHVLIPSELGISKFPCGSNINIDLKNIMHHETFSNLKTLKRVLTAYRLAMRSAISIYKAGVALKQRVDSAGGLKSYIQHLRKQAIKRLIDEAPFHAALKDDKVSYENFKLGETSRYVLAHLGAFDYDKLFGDDPSCSRLINDPVREAEGFVFMASNLNLFSKVFHEFEAQEGI